MINLFQFDKVNEKVDKTKTWYNSNTKFIYSREIQYKPFYLFKRKWCNDTSNFIYYLIMSDVKTLDETFRKTKVDDYGRIKIRCDSVKDITLLNEVKGCINVNIKKIDEDDESIVYELNI